MLHIQPVTSSQQAAQSSDAARPPDTAQKRCGHHVRGGITSHRLLGAALHADYGVHVALLQPVVLSLVMTVAAGVHALAAGRHQLTPAQPDS